MKLFLADEMHKLDAKAIKEIGMPELVLMENAGRGITEAVEEYLEEIEGRHIVILAGKGNNGGDGLVAARLLAKAGAEVTVVLAEAAEKLSASTFTEYQILQQCLVEILFWDETLKTQDYILEACLEANVVIDALLGTGFKGKLHGNYEEIITALPEEIPVIAVDIPSGVEADTGRVDKALPAVLTVTMIAPKLGLYLYPGAAYSGDVWVADLGSPGILVEAAACKHFLLTSELIQQLLPQRAPTAHKGTNGRIALLAGSRGYVGAAELVSKAAVRAGSGLVHLYTSPETVDILSMKLTEIMVEAMDMSATTEGFDALGIGPGLGKNVALQEALRKYLLGTTTPLVIDADGLNAFVGYEEELTKVQQKILTPHPAELARLLAVTTQEILQDPIGYAKLAAAKFQGIVLLKTVPAMVALPSGTVYLNTSGNEGMATGGCGDVLTGIITALLGQHLDLAEAALCGMYIHGRAGDLAAQRGKIGMKAGDLIDWLPQAIDMVLQGIDIE